MVVGVGALAALLPQACSPPEPPSFTAPVAAAETPAETTAPVPPTSITLPVDPQLLVFGDSYTEGNGADSSETTFAHTAADRLRWPVETDGRGGTGFLNAGPGGETFAQRLPSLEVEAEPNVVIVQGGLNDRDQSGDLTSAAREVLALARQQFPGAQLVLLGPVDPAPPNSRVASVVADLTEAAATEGVPFIDASGWLTPENVGEYGLGDGLHLSQAGHDYVGSRLAEAITALAG